jgi:uncharacterized membrane protein YebE (DUF533 family)
MGLFDNLFTRETSTLPATHAEAYMAVILCAAECDGHISDSETRNITLGMMRMKLYETYTEQKRLAVYDECTRLIKREGAEPLLQRAAAILPDELRLTAFANACDLILADGIVEEREKQYLDLLLTSLKLDQETGINIVEVMLIKNRG